MQNRFYIGLPFLLLTVLAGCQGGDPDALSQAVRAADLDIVAITVEPANGTIKTGYAYPFSATGTKSDGSTVDITSSVSWSSSDQSIATVDSGGTVSTISDGVTSITATLAAHSGSTQLTASPVALDPGGIRFVPDPLSISACGQLQLTAYGTYGGVERTSIPVTRFITWDVTSANGLFSGQGLLIAATDAGTIDVQASLDGSTVPASVNVGLGLSAITITPAAPIIDLNQTLQFTATGTYADSSSADITQRVVWSSDTTSVATIDAAGSATGVGAGTSTIGALCGGTSASGVTLTVSNAILDYLRFEDANDANFKVININVGDVIQMDLEAYYTNNTHVTVTESAQWSTLDNSSSIAIVNNAPGDKGIITGIAPGQHALVEAIYENREKILVVNVN